MIAASGTPVQKPQVVWQVDKGRWIDSAPINDPTDHTVYAAGSLHRVWALDGATGEEIWETDVGDFLDSSPRLVPGGPVLIKSFQDEALAHPSLHALDRATGTRLWEADLGRQAEGPWIAPDGTICALERGRDSALVAREPETGNVRWRLPARGVAHWGQIFFGKDAVYATLQEGSSNRLVAVDLESGHTRWTFQGQPGEDMLATGKSLAPSGDVVTVSWGEDGPTTVHCLDRITGEPCWSRRLGPHSWEPWFQPVFGPDGTIYAAELEKGGFHHHLVALEPSTGEVLWKHRGEYPEDVLFGSQGELFCSEVKYTAAEGFYYAFHRLDPETGKSLWNFEEKAGHDGAWVPEVTQSAENLYFDHVTGLKCLDKGTGRIKWQAATGCVAGLGAGVVYARTLDGKQVRALEQETGEPRWTFACDELTRARVTADGTVNISDHDGRIYCLSGAASQERFFPPTPGTAELPSEYFDWHTRLSLTECGVGQDDSPHQLVFDRDGNGEISADERDRRITLQELQGLDHDGDGLVSRAEMDKSGLYLFSPGAEGSPWCLGEIDAVADLERMNLEFRGLRD